jgi:hypothetical protein
MAGEGMRVVDEFNQARGRTQFGSGGSTSH